MHRTFIWMDGLAAEDFKTNPEGHMGGSLNMVPGYMGYMAANAITGHTRSWVMGQGHTVAAIDSVNLLMDNMTPVHAQRYSLSDEGLSRYVRDFYSYVLGEDGRQESPLGSHVNAYTAGAMQANPHLRPRVGNPDEMKSNRMHRTLDALKFRVAEPEPDIPKAVGGAVITALNEEAIASAALANKGGINLVHTYEAFGAKMHGVVRQEITFADQIKEAGQGAKWLSVPLIMTSHTWENGKDEISHQDPVLSESLLNEPSDISRVAFPADYNTAQVVMRGVYQSHGQIWTVVVPKQPAIADLFTLEEAEQLMEQGAMRLDWTGHRATRQQAVLTAI